LPTASRRLPASARASVAARALIREVADGKLPGSMVEDAVLLTSELVTNAVRHAGDEPIDVRATVDDSGITVSVRDRGRGFDPADTVRSETGGWGLSIVEELSTDWGVVSDEDGTEVWFEVGRRRSAPSDEARPNVSRGPDPAARALRRGAPGPASP
jgi:anti-sigma regulatory factor (Ser/Thr protein kinase)